MGHAHTPYHVVLLKQAVDELTAALRDAKAGDIERALMAAEHASRILTAAEGWERAETEDDQPIS